MTKIDNRDEEKHTFPRLREWAIRQKMNETCEQQMMFAKELVHALDSNLGCYPRAPCIHTAATQGTT
jgi:hypothetical protein